MCSSLLSSKRGKVSEKTEDEQAGLISHLQSRIIDLEKEKGRVRKMELDSYIFSVWIYLLKWKYMYYTQDVTYFLIMHAA